MNKKTKRTVALVLLPIVVLGMYFVISKNRTNEIYATDPLIVTYNGDIPPDPMFTLDDMKPGDTYERCFNVANGSPEAFAVEMSGFKTLEEKGFTEVLNILVYDSATNDVVFSGLLKDFFNNSPFGLGNFTAGGDRTFCIEVNFPKEAGNEYQEAKVVFDIIWRTEIPEDDIPPECWDMADKFDSVIYGTEGNDRIHGNVGSNLIFALGGDDWVDSSSGDDCVVLGDGNDYVRSESGNDTILGGSGNDKIYSGSGNDRIYGGPGNDKLYAGSGDDYIEGGLGDDKIEAGSGNDIVYGNEGDDEINAGSGNDYVYGGSGNDVIRGGSGDDALYGEEGDDILRGQTGNDYLNGGSGYDVLKGNFGTDTCVFGEIYSSCEIL